MKELITCPNCGMTNMIIFDTFLPYLSGTFLCTDCEKEYKVTGNTKIEEIIYEDKNVKS